jgi:hypothetical protein
MSIGFYITAHNEIRATEALLKNIRDHHPNDPIFLVSDGGHNYENIIRKIGVKNISFRLESDSIGPTFMVTDQNFTLESSQISIKNAIKSFLERMEEAIEILNVSNIVVMDPDTKIKKNIEFITGGGLLGSLVNSHLPEEFNRRLVRFGGLPIKRFGANPAIFRTDKFKEGLNSIRKFGDIFFDELCSAFYGVYAYDLLIPIVLSMAGESEQLNVEIVECKRNRLWRFSRKSIIHQYRRYYD